MAVLDRAGRQGIEHPLVEAGTQQSDEPASVLPFDVLGQPHGGAELAVMSAELRVRGRAEVVDVDAQQPEDLLGRRP